MGEPEERNTVPWYFAGMNPDVQFLAPEMGPPDLSSMTT